MLDRDIGEIFINFILSEEVRPFWGFGVSNVSTENCW